MRRLALVPLVGLVALLSIVGNLTWGPPSTLTQAADPVCGNDIVEPPEECEPPNTGNNSYCPAIPEHAGPVHSWITGVPIGNCDSVCHCLYQTASVYCKKGSNGAQCQIDADCVPPLPPPPCNGIYDCQCVGPVGGVAEAPDGDASALEATASGGSSSPPYAAIAGAAAGGALLLAGVTLRVALRRRARVLS